MPYYFFLWQDDNTDHVGQHGVTPEEFEEVVCQPDFVEPSRSSDRLIAFGITSTGKYLACVYEMLDSDTVYPVTAFEPEE